MMWWILYVISFISNVILFLFYSHTFIVKLYKSVTCWMCMCMHGMDWMNIIWASLWRRDTCHVGTLWPGYTGVPSYQVFTVFSSNSYMCFSCKYYAGFFVLYTSTHFLIDWQPGVGILLLHINLCLLVITYNVALSCFKYAYKVICIHNWF